MRHRRTILLTLALVSTLLIASCTSNKADDYSALPTLKIGQEYEVKVADHFYSTGRVVDQRPGWIQMDFGESPAGGWASTLWLRQSEIVWIGECDRKKSEQLAELRLARTKLVLRIEALKLTRRKDSPLIQKAIDELNRFDEQQADQDIGTRSPGQI